MIYIKTKKKLRRGFALLDKKTITEIARSGGKAAWAMGKAHSWTSEEAKKAGAIGGRTRQKKRKK